MKKAGTNNASTNDKVKCTCCGDFKDQKDGYYMSSSILNKQTNRLTVCKDCLVIIYNQLLEEFKSEKTALYKLCRLVDACFNNTVYLSAKEQAEKQNSNIAKIYFQKINSAIGKNNGIGNTFEYSDVIDEKEIQNIQSGVFVDYEDELKDFEVTKDMVMFFGRGYNKEDYWFLVNEYQDWITKYECDSKAMETLIKQICVQMLDIEKRRANNEKVDQQLKTLQELMGSSNLKPVQETGANAAEQLTFGMLIKKLENDQPVDEPLDEWKDPDNFEKWQKIFTGHLADMNDIDNEIVREYKELIKPYTVNDKDGE
jgi:hypothetical protein